MVFAGCLLIKVTACVVVSNTGVCRRERLPLFPLSQNNEENDIHCALIGRGSQAVTVRRGMMCMQY